MIPNLISVVVPVFNRSGALRRTLESICAQTYQPIEVIVVNDGSTEDIKSVAQDFAATHYITQENQGAPTARNVAFSRTTGEYVLFCDADLVLNSRMFEKLHTALVANPKASYSYGGFKLGWKTFSPQPFDLEKLKQNNYIHTSALIRAKDFCGFDPELKRFQDWDVWLSMAEQSKYGVMVPEILFQIISSGTMSSWLPEFWYKMFPWSKKVQDYQAAKSIVQKKHKLE